MSPIAWALRPLKKYATFSGRAPRAEFWWFFLFIFVTYMVVSIVFGASLGSLAAGQTERSAGMLGAFGAGSLLMVLFWLALLIPTIAVQVRRLHDIDRSGWWIGGFYLLYAVYFFVMFGTLFSAGAMSGQGEAPATALGGGLVLTMILGFAMLIYGIVLLVFYCTGGTKGPNKYGDDPYGGNLGEVFA